MRTGDHALEMSSGPPSPQFQLLNVAMLQAG
jgi:hypothetical protein